MTPQIDAMLESIERLFVHRWDILPVRTSRGAFLLAYCPTEEAALELLRSHVTGCQATANCCGDRWFSLTDEFRVGSYLMTPDTDVCHELVIDLDGESHDKPACLEAAQGVVDLMQRTGPQPLLEVSGSGTGWHVRLLMDQPIRASTLRGLGHAFTVGIDAEVFPKNDRVAKGEYGNLVWLPHWHGSTGDNAFLCPERYFSYIANPRTVYRHTEDDVTAALGELSRRSRGRVHRKWSPTPVPATSLPGVKSTHLSPPLINILFVWVDNACTNARRGEGRHDLAVRLAARLRDNRIAEPAAVIAMKAFQEGTTSMRDHPFPWREAEAILRHAYRRSPRSYDHCVAAELHRNQYSKETSDE